MKRFILILIVVAIAAGGGYIFWKYKYGKQEQVEALKLIPSDAIFIVQTAEPVEGWKVFSKSSMWQHIKKYSPLGDIGKMADGITKTIEDNDLILSAVGHRNLLISAHMTTKNDYDFLYVCDLENSSKFNSVKDGIIQLIKLGGFRYSQSETAGQAVHHFYDPKDNSTLNLGFVANQLVCSYDHNIFRRSLEQADSGFFNNSVNFQSIVGELNTDGLCQIYLNHRYVPDYLGVYMDDISDMRSLFGSMEYTGASGSLEDEMVRFGGTTLIHDSMSSYLRALHRSGNSKTSAANVFSERTAFMLNLCFQSFPKFYENLKDVMKEDSEAWASFNKSKKTVETLLRFKLEEDLMSWIDDEVSVAQYQQDRVIGGEVHSLIAVKALSEEKALDKLGKLEKRLKLLGKFKSQEYKGHAVHYTEIRGLFKLLFGKLFDKVEKPYYCFLNDHMIFCDDAATLLHTIDDYDNGKTLGKNEEYREFADGFKKENSLFTFVNMKRYFLNLKGVLDAESYQTTYENRQFAICFQQMGFQFASTESGFDTRLQVQFQLPDDSDLLVTEGKPASIEEIEAQDSMSDADAWILEYVNGSARKEVYSNGSIKLLAELKDNVLHGRYLEYYENGGLKVKGKYRNGERSGKWIFYKDNGEIERKTRYREGKDESEPKPEEESS